MQRIKLIKYKNEFTILCETCKLLRNVCLFFNSHNVRRKVEHNMCDATSLVRKLLKHQE